MGVPGKLPAQPFGEIDRTMLAAGAAWDEAIRVANIAAGIVVGKLGTAVVTRQELLAAL